MTISNQHINKEGALKAPLMYRNLQKVNKEIKINDIVEFIRIPYNMVRITDKNGINYYGMLQDMEGLCS